MEEGERVVRVYIPSAEAMYKFPPQNWALIQLFDGNRTYEEIATLYSRQTGTEYSTETIREFADDLETADFWYKTPQEKNILLMQKSAEERHKLLKAKNRYGDLSAILFPAVNPDKFLTWLVERTQLMYTWWFTVLTLAAFAFRLASPSRIGRKSDATRWSFTTFLRKPGVISLSFTSWPSGSCSCMRSDTAMPASTTAAACPRWDSR